MGDASVMGGSLIHCSIDPRPTLLRSEYIKEFLVIHFFVFAFIIVSVLVSKSILLTAQFMGAFTKVQCKHLILRVDVESCQYFSNTTKSISHYVT